MINKIFVTGTDTDIGKTFVTLGLSLLTQNRGLKMEQKSKIQPI